MNPDSNISNSGDSGHGQMPSHSKRRKLSNHEQEKTILQADAEKTSSPQVKNQGQKIHEQFGQDENAAKAFQDPISKMLGQKTAQKTECVSFEISIKGTPAKWASDLSSVGFSKIHAKSGVLNLSYIESEDMSGNAHSFIDFEFSKNSLKICYSVSQTQSPALRKLRAAQLALLCISSMGAEPAISQKFASFLSNCLEEASQLSSTDSALLMQKNRELEESISKLQERIDNLYAEREAMARQFISDAAKISELNSQLLILSSTPDSVFDDEVLSWLISHDGQICIREFCQKDGAPAGRVEQSLNRLATSGRLSRIKNPGSLEESAGNYQFKILSNKPNIEHFSVSDGGSLLNRVKNNLRKFRLR
ncbi:MAG: hypothetical protein WC492_00010 [Candidatus Micrarchaeia archaeon]